MRGKHKTQLKLALALSLSSLDLLPSNPQICFGCKAAPFLIIPQTKRGKDYLEGQGGVVNRKSSRATGGLSLAGRGIGIRTVSPSPQPDL